jgi:hypothetical protein
MDRAEPWMTNPKDIVKNGSEAGSIARAERMRECVTSESRTDGEPGEGF